MTIQAVFFDFGGVILRTASHAPRHRWDATLGLPPGTVEELFFNSPRGRAAQHGHHSEAAQWRWLGAELGLSAEQLTTLRADFWVGDVLDAAVLAVLRGLRPAYRVGLISNAMDGLRPYLDEQGLLPLFDAVVISAEFGTMKPDPAIYTHALAQLDVPAAAAVFIDDFAHNIAGAHAVGMHGIHMTPATDLAAELARLGVG